MNKQEYIERLSYFKRNIESAITAIPQTGETTILRDVYQASVSGYETAIQLAEQLDEPTQEPCEYCTSFNGILNAFGFININEVGSFCEPHCMNCGRKLVREGNHT